VAPLSLRAGLVLALVALVALGLVGAGAASTAALSSYMVGELDQRLIGLGRNVVARGLPARLVPPNAPPPAPLLPSAFVLVVTDGSGNAVTTVDTFLSGGDPMPAFPHWDVETVRAHGREPVSVNSVESDGPRWRLVALPLADGSGSVLVASGLHDVDATLRRLVLLSVLIGTVVLLLVAALAHRVVRRSLRPLSEVETTAEAIAAGEFSRRVPDADPRTEVGRLGRALNVMLGRIEVALHVQRKSEASARQSEDRMRRFVADASHELRTPLTSIRGFAELYRQGAASDVGRLMERIESESERMGVLVNDLLMLARMDEERVPVRAPVDLVGLAADAAHDARAVEPGRPVLLDAPEFVVVSGDEHQLRQVLANLVGNALHHTPSATTVTVRVRADGADALIEVIDEGPGLGPEHADRIFERFYRADASRSRASGGSGLGLSIVAAIAEGHGGRAEVETAPGKGALFRVRIPRSAARSAD
jgi:two-component system OmpR family sensor kinase